MVPPAKKLEDLIHLAELCVDLLQQNEEHYAEVIPQSPPPEPTQIPSNVHYCLSLPYDSDTQDTRALVPTLLISMRASGYWYTIIYYVPYRRTMNINLSGNL